MSPNANLVIKKYYAKCGHTTKEYGTVPEEIVNFDEKQTAEYYSNWDLKGFSNNEIVIYKEFEGSCDEHYIIKVEDGILVIYNIDDNGVETLKEKTTISTNYLPEEDLVELEKGIKIFGKDNLNATIEDFE